MRHTLTNEPVFHQDKTFQDIDFSNRSLRDREFANCTFINCDFSNSDLGRNNFDSCHFRHCNLTTVELAGAGLRDIQFEGCKLMGINFSTCNPFGFSVDFRDCMLDYAVCFGLKMKKTTFLKCSLKQVEFEQADLSGSLFDECDLSEAHFAQTNLEKVDFRSAYHFDIQPEVNKMKGAKFVKENLAGLLNTYKLDIR